MREDICSIPISEIFEPKDGCPFCRMRDMLEDRMATYITGAAMMEPDVRVETNRLGFCHQHFEQILQRGSRLSVALILESLLDEAGKDILPEDDKLAPKKILAAADRRAHSCFVCENVEKNMQHLSFHRQCVLEMEMILIVLAQQLPRCLSLHGLFHLWFLLVYFANRSLTTWLAAMSPATGGTKGTLPGVLRRVLPGSGSGWNNVLWGSSVE